MDKTKLKLAAFFDNDDDESFSHKAVDNQKLSQYTSGTVRKSRREKEKEAAEQKKKEEEENAAKAYAEFLDEFEREDGGKKKITSTFVKSSTDSNSVYVPLKSQLGPPSRSGGLTNAPASRRSPTPPLNVAPKPKGKRAMDAFLEEIKRDQAEREARYSRNSHGRSVTALAAYEGQSGSKDRGDPETSNIFVANLPPHVTEQSLGTFFARIGPVGSVKIMWPRADGTVGPGQDMTASRRAKNNSLSGFVSFMKRKDAEAALRDIDGFEWGGSVLRVGWSKAVPVGPKPLYTYQGSQSRDSYPARSASRGRSRSRSIDGSRSRSRDGRHYRSSRRSRSPSRSRSRSHSRYRRSHRRDGRSSSRRRRSRSQSPRRRNEEDEAVTDTFVRAVASEIKGNGDEYEGKLLERERKNPKFAFLVHRDHQRYRYYRDLVDGADILEPEFDDEGYNSVYSTDSAEDSERERTRKAVLGKLARKRFEAMLRGMSGKQGELARCMAFSLDHAEAASEVSDIIIASLLVDGTPVPRKVSRLHLICDILHNSAASVPSAWKYRQEFQARLGIVFDHLGNIYHSFPGRITAETFKKQIISVVDIWEDWIVFPPEFTSELRMRLEGSAVETEKVKEESTVEDTKSTTEAPSRFKASSFQPATAVPTADEVEASRKSDDGEPMDEGSDAAAGSDVDGILLDEELDGEPMDDDVDGIPMDDDVDGIPLDEDDVDGIPIDDMDGEPLAATVADASD